MDESQETISLEFSYQKTMPKIDYHLSLGDTFNRKSYFLACLKRVRAKNICYSNDNDKLRLFNININANVEIAH